MIHTKSIQIATKVSKNIVKVSRKLTKNGQKEHNSKTNWSQSYC
jgi:hypothetical protein